MERIPAKRRAQLKSGAKPANENEETFVLAHSFWTSRQEFQSKNGEKASLPPLLKNARSPEDDVDHLANLDDELTDLRAELSCFDDEIANLNADIASAQRAILTTDEAIAGIRKVSAMVEYDGVAAAVGSCEAKILAASENKKLLAGFAGHQGMSL